MHFGSNQQIREELVHSISNDYSSIVNDLSKYAKTQNLIVPAKSQEQWIDMLSHGEKVENFLNYIDNFSKSSNPYPHNEFEKMIDFLAPVQKEPVVGKGLADFMTEIYREYHSGSEKNIQNERGQSVRSIEDVLDRSRELGLTLSKNHIEVIRASIEEKKLSVEEHIEQLEKMGARHAEKGYAWHIREDHNPKYPLLYYIDKHNNINCYVVERTNSQTDERFFVANRINENGEHFKITSNNNLDIVKNHVAAYYTGVTIREFSLEMSKSFEKSQQSSPTGTKELELSL